MTDDINPHAISDLIFLRIAQTHCMAQRLATKMKKQPKASFVFDGSAARWRWLELFTLFIVLPLIAYLWRQHLQYWLVPLLLAIALFCYTLISRDASFKRFRLTNTPPIRPWLTRRLPVFVIGLLLCALVYSQFAQARWFYLPRQQTSTWLAVLVTYPILSVWPQELIYRTFLFHRYKKIMPRKKIRVLFSALLFAFAHIVYDNGIAVALSFIGGLLFAYTYAKTRSTLTCVVEHSVWGILLFTLGLG